MVIDKEQTLPLTRSDHPPWLSNNETKPALYIFFESLKYDEPDKQQTSKDDKKCITKSHKRLLFLTTAATQKKRPILKKTRLL